MSRRNFTSWVITDFRGIDDGAIFETCESERETAASLNDWPDGARAFECRVVNGVATDDTTREITDELRKRKAKR